MLTDKEKREAIEKALGESLERAMDAGDETHGQCHDVRWVNRDYHKGQILAALAEDAIVVPAEVEHIMAPGFVSKGDVAVTEIRLRDDRGITHLFRYANHLGKPGKAVALIIPEEASDDKDDHS